jgi:hypothetical protein
MIERRRHEKKIMRRRPHPHACPACMVAARRYVEEYINSPRARDFPRKVEEAKHLIPQATPPLPSLTSPPLPFVAFPFPLLRASIFSGSPRSPIFNPPPLPPSPWSWRSSLFYGWLPAAAIPVCSFPSRGSRGCFCLLALPRENREQRV